MEGPHPCGTRANENDHKIKTMYRKKITGA